jgi:hypothetical protein
MNWYEILVKEALAGNFVYYENGNVIGCSEKFFGARQVIGEFTCSACIYSSKKGCLVPENQNHIIEQIKKTHPELFI